MEDGDLTLKMPLRALPLIGGWGLGSVHREGRAPRRLADEEVDLAGGSKRDGSGDAMDRFFLWDLTALGGELIWEFVLESSRPNRRVSTGMAVAK